jgi:CHAT domain-containing protein
MGNLLFRRGDLNSAQEYFKRSLAIVSKDAERPKAQLLANLATCAIERGAYAEAERYNQEALEIKRALKDAGAELHSNLISADIAAHENQPQKAAPLYRLVFDASDSDNELRWEAHAGLAKLLAASGQKVQAEKEFRRAIELVENASNGLKDTDHKLTFFSSLIKFYDNYVSFLIETGKPREALEIAERSRARILSERLERKTATAQVSAPDLIKLAAALNSTLISYWLSPVKSYVWVIDSKGVQFRQLSPESEIRANVAAYNKYIQHSRDPVADHLLEGSALYRMLVEPVADLIPPGAQVIIVPDGSLHQLNFESLIVPKPVPHYWIEDVSVMVTPSLGQLTVGVPNRRAESLLLIGNPKSPDPRFPDLPNAAGEIEQMAIQFPVAQRTVHSGENANPDTYREAIPNRFGFIHFAAHATANTESPLDSAVILSRKNESYRLYARDVVAMPITAELVSISACRGAGAKAFAGEGLVGFAWAFLSAGAQNVIAGLWDVEDGSTSRVMIQLYREIKEGRTPQQALRDAKLTLLHSDGAFAKPYYWAPFISYTRQPAPAARR